LTGNGLPGGSWRTTLLFRQMGMAALMFLVNQSGLSSEAPIVGSYPAPPVERVFTNALQAVHVAAYQITGDPDMTKEALAANLDRYTGTNTTLREIVKAASTLQLRYFAAGYTNVNLTIGREEITNGVVTIHVFRGVLGQIVIDGRRCAPIRVETSTSSGLAAGRSSGPSTNGPAGLPSNPGASASRNAPQTNAAPGLLVRAYEIRGDTLLSTPTLISILGKYTGTNITVPDILKAGNELQMEYRKRGYATVKVTIPPQKLDSNAIVKIRVFEGRLAEINVSNNHYFSSNNVMRGLPSLHANMLLLQPLFEAELDRANANQDRQIYPQIEPGPTPGTTILDLNVKDRLPLHAKVDFNDQNSPGTPDLRVNSSLSYNNLWQLEHSLGLQYSFSPEEYKSGDQWNFYDRPLVANYSGFYRLPFGSFGALENSVLSHPTSFGYDEATRKFRLPPNSGQPEFIAYASRSTIDTGLMTITNRVLTPTNEDITVARKDVQQDLTINESVGFRLSKPLNPSSDLLSSLSVGGDWKSYDFTSFKTNLLTFTTVIRDQNNHPVQTNVSTVPSPVPLTHQMLDYFPLASRYDGTWRDAVGVTTFGLGLSANAWYSGSLSNLQSITASRQSSGHWVTLTPSLSRDLLIHTNWVLSLRAEGQWASQPLISNEQFGIGGINTVRGYHEGEIFGDTGWWAGAEQKTPPYFVGMVYPNHPLSVRGLLFMEYGQAYLLDPQGRPERTPLWGTGFGAAANIGATWGARFIFSWPLLDAGTVNAFNMRFDFSLTAQF
jgi:hemolysin activation/secretion protein